LDTDDLAGRETAPFVSTPHLPVSPPRLRPPLPPWVNLACLLITFASTLLAGALLSREDPPSLLLLAHIAASPSAWLTGLPYAVSVLFILGAHEMGHYLACRWYRIEATLPFFLPGPNLFGTFGAVIRIRAPFTTRRALFDVGVAGPLAGFVAALPILYYGLVHSTVVTTAPRPGTIGLTDCLLLHWLYPRFFVLGADVSVQLHPVFAAAWLGLFATALNLLPIGQLDGGHMLYALSPRAHGTVSRLGIVALVACGLWFGGWHLLIFAALFAFLGVAHPRPIDDQTPLDGARIAVALAGLLIFILCFIPTTPQVFGGD
jgi:membrane-associated protease RseP (regulator of RpoE activity)